MLGDKFIIKFKRLKIIFENIHIDVKFEIFRVRAYIKELFIYFKTNLPMCVCVGSSSSKYKLVWS